MCFVKTEEECLKHEYVQILYCYYKNINVYTF